VRGAGRTAGCGEIIAKLKGKIDWGMGREAEVDKSHCLRRLTLTVKANMWNF
jgi:hypothetical protein